MNWLASLELAYQQRDGETIPCLRRHMGPLRIQKGLNPEGLGVWHQIVVHPPGGIASGDQLRVNVQCDAHAHALLTSPGAAKWYRARSGAATDVQAPHASQHLTLCAADGAILEWLPQENLFFSATQARLETRIETAGSGCVMALELHCLGRPASGDGFEDGKVRMRTSVVHDQQLIFSEGLTVDALVQQGIAGLAGNHAWGQLLIVSSKVENVWQALGGRQWAEGWREQEVAVTLLNGCLVARWRGMRADSGMESLRRCWAQVRPVVAGREAVRPRIWLT